MNAVLQQFKQAAAAQTAQRKAAAAAAQAAAAKQYILSHDSGSQLLGLGKGFVEGFVGAAVGTGQLVLETGWTAYHSTIAYATDRDAFNVQWDTNQAVATYVWNHPVETGGALVGGLVDGTVDKLAHGNVGEAIGEVGGQLAFFGGVAKVVSLARGAAGIERTAAAAEAEAEFPAIKAGSAGGETAGKAFPESVRGAALEENPGTCVYCHMETDAPQVDHAIPRAQGGNATLDNAQTTCPWCNASKGARKLPVNPPPGYRGAWPPWWWGL